MNTPFDLLGSVSPGRESWRFKVYVLRLWTVSAFLKPDQLNSLEMVLIDEKRVKIHACVRRQLLYLFSSKIVEGNVYKMSHFTVSPESGVYRTTSHPYKLNFEMKTKVQASQSLGFDRFGLSLSSIAEICGYGPDHDFLVDVVALITGISPEKQYVRDGKVTRLVVLELSDNSGKCECSLFGDYVEELQSSLVKAGDGLPVVVLQFAKIKTFRGSISIQNVLNATRIFVNPLIPEVVSFKHSLAVDGVELAHPIPTLGQPAKVSLEEEFLVKYPKTSIAHLHEFAEDGMYVVSAVVDGLVEDEDWWYPSCRCHRSLSSDSGAYFCKKCDKHVFKMVPRFRVKLRVEDGTAEAVFVVFDSDMNTLVGKYCPELVAMAKSQNGGYYPPELVLLKGRRLLFKVEKFSRFPLMFDGSFRVKKLCSDVEIIESFDAATTVVAKSDYGVGNEIEDGVEYVDNSQFEEEFVADLIVPSSVAKDDNSVDDSTVDYVSSFVNLDDDSDAGVEVFVPERIRKDAEEYLSAKRNLTAAFDDCVDGGGSYSKIRKVSGD